MRSASRRRAGSMKCCLACFLLLAGADTFRTRVESLRQSSLAHFTEQTSRHVPSSAGAAFDTQRMNAANSSRRRKNRRAMHRTADGVCLMSVDPGMESDSRIRGDPAALERWLSSGGGILGPVVLEETPRTGWGLRAERDLEAGETVAVVPRSMCLGLAQTPAEGESETTREDNAWTGPPCVQALVEQVPEEFADVRLGLVLLHERFKTGSTWESYVQNLPSTFRGLPLSSFRAVEMRALQDRTLSAQIDKRCIFLVSFVKDVLDPLELGPNAPFGEQRVTFGEIAWATAAVSSRAFTHLYGGWRQEEKPLLVPFLDMLNFNFEESNVQVVSAWPSDGEEVEEGEERPDRPEVRLVTTQAVAKGQSLEIREHYSNAERLCKYGFVDLKKKNERNTFTFEKKVLKAARIVAGILDEPFGARFEADALEPWQQRVLIDLRLDGPGADLTVHLGGDSTRGRLPVDERLLAALRVMFSRSKQELEGKTAKQLGRYKTGKLSVYVEQRVLATVLGLSLIYVQQWPTTLEQDEVTLYGRRVTPTLEEALSVPPPWQALAPEDMSLQDVLIERLVKEEIARWQGDEEDELEEDTGEGTEEEEEEGEEEEGEQTKGDKEEDTETIKEEGGGEADGEAGGEREEEEEEEGQSVEDESCDEEARGEEAGEGGEDDDDQDDDESTQAGDGQEEAEREEGEGDAEGEETAGGFPAVKPELTWEMVQAIGYRLAKKRAIMDVGLLARAELRKTGLAEGMMDNARPSVGPLAEWISEPSVLRPKKDLDHPAENV